MLIMTASPTTTTTSSTKRPPCQHPLVLKLAASPQMANTNNPRSSSPISPAAKAAWLKRNSFSHQNLMFTSLPKPLAQISPVGHSTRPNEPSSQDTEAVGVSDIHQHMQGLKPRSRSHSSTSLAKGESPTRLRSESRASKGSSSTAISAPSTPLLFPRGHRQLHEQADGKDYFFTPSPTPKVYPPPPPKSAPASPRARTRSLKQNISPINSRPNTPGPRLRSTSHPHLAQMFFSGPGAPSSTTQNMTPPQTTYATPMMHTPPLSSLDTLGLYMYAQARASHQASFQQSTDSEDDDPMTFGPSRSRRSSRRSSGLRSRQSWAEMPLVEPTRPEGIHTRANARVSSLMGDTETEDDVTRILPTSRRVQSPSPAPLSKLLMFRWLSVIPPLAAASFHFSAFINPPSWGKQFNHTRADYIICLFWALLTAYQNLSIATGLLHRWRFYYPLLPTIIRLLALQAICWPATHYTLRIFDHLRRPLVCWTLIGTTACLSKAIQMWATSNLRGGIDNTTVSKSRPASPVPPSPLGPQATRSYRPAANGVSPLPSTWAGAALSTVADWADGALEVLTASSTAPEDGFDSGRDGRSRTTGSMRPRRWDWTKVLRKCVGPAASLYFLMAWVLLLKKEFVSTNGC